LLLACEIMQKGVATLARLPVHMARLSQKLEQF